MVHVTARGAVQGVGYRWFARERARALRLAGWARNHADGSVEVLVSGPPADVDTFLGLLKGGPPRARVDALEVRDALPGEQVTVPFDIRSR
jgi:acylphosphatase